MYTGHARGARLYGLTSCQKFGIASYGIGKKCAEMKHLLYSAIRMRLPPKAACHPPHADVTELKRRD